MKTDLQHLQELIDFTRPFPTPFGARIVTTETGELLLQVVNRVQEDNDPTAHAELLAVRLACQRLGSTSLAGYTLYSTCEPCPMCMSSLLWAGLDRLVYGATVADAAAYCAQIYVPATEVAQRSDLTITINGPLLRDECQALFATARWE